MKNRLMISALFRYMKLQIITSLTTVCSARVLYVAAVPPIKPRRETLLDGYTMTVATPNYAKRFH